MSTNHSNFSGINYNTNNFSSTWKSYYLILLYGLLFIVFNPLSLFAQDEEFTTAQEKVSLADNAVHAIATDAKLILVMGDDVSLKGETSRWKYFYKSESKNKLYEFWYDGGSLVQKSTISHWEDFHVSLGMHALPESWIDSDNAISIAESNGGSNFRTANGNQASIEMTLLPSAIGSSGGVAPLYPNSVWWINYRSNDNYFTVILDAVTGAILDYERTTAKELYPYIDTLAKEIVSDAKLFKVTGRLVDTNGKSGEWNYEFHSLSQQITFSFYNMGGRLGKNFDFTEPPDHIYSDFFEIPDSWMNSDSAITMAESRGGNQFRENHSDWEINLHLQKQKCDYSNWEIYYNSSSVSEYYKIYAVAVVEILNTSFEQFAEVDSIASDLINDVQLVFVYAEDISVTGGNSKWNYIYWSLSQQKGYQFIATSIGLICQEDQITGPVPEPELNNLKTLPDYWLDIDSALVITEKSGGKEFRQTHPDWSINAYLEVAENDVMVRWHIYYNSNSGSIEFWVNAFESRKTTAYENVSSVDSVAIQKANDAQLVFLSGSNVGADGKSDQWYYVYDSPRLQKVFELWVIGGQIIEPLNPAFPETESGKCPIPKYWMNSDSAIAYAESMGGKEFRLNEEGWEIHMNLHAFTTKSAAKNTDLVTAIWNMYYESNSGNNQQYAFDAAVRFVTIGWPKTFGGDQADMGLSIQLASDGGYIISGLTNSFGAGMSDTWLIKTDTAAAEVWNKTFGSEFDDFGKYIEQTTENDYLIAHNGKNNTGLHGASLLKTYPNGNEKLGRGFDGEGNNIANCIHTTSDSSYIMAGTTTSSGAGLSDVWLIKIDKNGNKLWSKTFGGAGDDSGEFMWQTPDNGYIIVGSTNSFGAGENDVWLIKTDENGIEEWNKTFGGVNNENGKSIDLTVDGGFIIAGFTESGGAGNQDFLLLKTNSKGNEEWSKTFGGAENDFANCVRQTSDGGFVVVGSTQSFGSGKYDVWLIKTDEIGTESWSSTVGGTDDDFGESVCQANDGSFAITGGTFSYGAGDCDVILAKIDSAGVITNEKTLVKSDNILQQNFPNPFHGQTTIPIYLKQSGHFKIRILDMVGREVVVLLNQAMYPGQYKLTWDGRAANGKPIDTGIYFCELTVNMEKQVKRMVLIK